MPYKDINKRRKYKKTYNKAYRAKRRIENPAKYRESVRNYDLRRTFGISTEEYDKLLNFQKGVCYICGRPPKTRRLSVDHKHLINEKKIRLKKDQHLIRNNIRGLLCSQCNRGLQFYRDNSDLFRKAASYLELHPAQEILRKTTTT